MNILVLCRGNSARSILLESILSQCGDGRFSAYSAGSQPTGSINPAAIAQLEGVGLAVSGLRSKSWDEFTTPSAPTMDLVVTVCGNARDETCPVWLGAPVSAHWGADDPAVVSGPDTAVRKAFSEAYTQLRKYADVFMAEAVEDMDRAALHEHVRKIEGLK